MIEGAVNAAHQPVVTLTMQGPSGQSREVEAVIDTGFTGFLTVTPELATELGLSLQGTGRATLANGSEVICDVYDVAVLWDGQPRYVLADAVGTTPLVGMRLMAHHSLDIELVDGGRVVIQAEGS